MRHGQGHLFEADGALYLKAAWINDCLTGTAELFMANNDHFIGQMANNRKHGKGVYKYSDGTVYEGEFREDSQTGRGVLRYLNGDVYEGGLVDGLFSGEGRYHYKEEGMVYEGHWRNGVEYGKGVFVYQGQFRIETVLEQRQLLTFNMVNIAKQ